MSNDSITSDIMLVLARCGCSMPLEEFKHGAKVKQPLIGDPEKTISIYTILALSAVLVNLLVLFILQTHETTSLTLSIGELLPRPTFADTGSSMSACFLFAFSIFFSVYMPFCNRYLCCLFTPHKQPVKKSA